jgi:protein tyrosine/serine phosphatase
MRIFPKSRAVRRVIGVVLIGLLAIGGYTIYILAINNFHAIVPGVAYRAAQLDADNIRTYVERHGIRSIVNLRGAHPGDPWYDEEAGAARRHGLALFDFPISGTRILPIERTHELVAVLEQAPLPVLIHCESGADRSGLAAALFLLSNRRTSLAVASSQLSLAYGHFPFFLSKTGAMDQTLANYAATMLAASDGKAGDGKPGDDKPRQ